MSEESLENKQESVTIQLPFNNLFLNAGFINGDNSPVKYIIVILTSIFAYFVYQLFMMMILVYYAQQNGANIMDVKVLERLLLQPTEFGISKNLLFTLLLGMFAFTFWVFYMSIKKIQHKNLISVITAFPQIRWNRVLFSFAIWSVVFLMMFVADYVWLSPENYVLNFDVSNFLALLLISIVFLPIQTSFEEIFFRGYLMHGFSLVFKNGLIPLLFTSLLFGLAHINNPETQSFGLSIMLPYYSLFGMFLGLLALWNNGLELSIGIHTANNILSSLLITSKSSVLQTDAIFLIKNENPVNDFILWMAGAIITLFLFQFKFKFKNHIQLLK